MISALLLLVGQAPPPTSAIEVGGRPSITYLLGEDEDPRLPLFRMAEVHFRHDPAERTDEVVQGLRSLDEVRRHLTQSPRPGGMPWGVVNLVVHGNATGYIDLPVSVGGVKANAGSLTADLAARGRDVLPDTVLDADSEIRVHGCALGRDTSLLSSLARWFGGGDLQRPKVRASLWYTAFRPLEEAGKGPSRSLCEWWDVYYHAGKPPASADLKAGPLGAASRAGVELAEALSRRAPARPGGSYSYEAPARFTWTLVYSASADVPAIQSGSFARLWLLKQEPFLQRLRSAGIPFQQLDWTVSRVEHAANGEVRPALRTLGEGRVLHVLRQLVRKPGDSGPEPQDAWDDPRYYATAR